jgi:hypothetical protein
VKLGVALKAPGIDHLVRSGLAQFQQSLFGPFVSCKQGNHHMQSLSSKPSPSLSGGCSERSQTQVQRCAETIYTHGLKHMWSHRESRFMSFESGKTSLHQPSDGVCELTGALLAPHLPNLTTRKCPFLTRPTAHARASAVTLMVNFVKDERISCNLSERHCPVL